MKHTPGPWVYSAWDGWKSVGNSKEFLLHNGRIFFPHNPADWHLIASAPDMLEALKMALDVMTKHSIEEVKAKIHAAIAKATGESQ